MDSPVFGRCGSVEGITVETVTVAASRGSSLWLGTTLGVVCVVVLGVVAFAAFKHFRNAGKLARR